MTNAVFFCSAGRGRHLLGAAADAERRTGVVMNDLVTRTDKSVCCVIVSAPRTGHHHPAFKLRR